MNKKNNITKIIVGVFMNVSNILMGIFTTIAVLFVFHNECSGTGTGCNSNTLACRAGEYWLPWFPLVLLYLVILIITNSILIFVKSRLSVLLPVIFSILLLGVNLLLVLVLAPMVRDYFLTINIGVPSCMGI